MFSLLIVIYIAFISLGLPDSLLGAAWPMMYQDMGVPVSYAGIISMTICFGTVISSLLYGKLNSRFSTQFITAVSAGMTALALFLISLSPSFPVLILIALFLGLGAGSVDAGLNSYVSIHFKAREMSFLHAFWGIGTTVGPFLLSWCFSNGFSWNRGYLTVSLLQALNFVILVLSFPLWRKAAANANHNDSNEKKRSASFRELVRKRAAIPAMIGFFGYCAAESTAILWSSTFLVSKGAGEAAAASASGLLFWGITAGRIVSGFISNRMGDRRMLNLGECCTFIAIAFIIILPQQLAPFALFFLGFGFGPIYPSMINQTPKYFGVEDAPGIMGLEMASAYIGSTFMPALFGLLSRHLSLAVFPIWILILFIIHTAGVLSKRKLRYGSEKEF